MILETLKVIFLGIVEGITEWLPISSTGHMILVDEFVHLDVSPEFFEMFLVVIQLGAIMAVVVIYWGKLWPFSRNKTRSTRRATLSLWLKVIVGTIPSGIIGLLLDDWMTEHLHKGVPVAIALIVYGIAFIVIERHNRSKAQRVARGELLVEPVHTPQHMELNALALDDEDDSSSAFSKVRNFEQLSYGRALAIGCFEALAVVPGTSRSGSIILGSMILGVNRTVATEFAFFLAIPIMFGWSVVKMLKFGFAYTSLEVFYLVLGCVVAFVVSILAIKFLIGYIKRNDFTVFGWYRIALGLVVLGVFLFVL